MTILTSKQRWFGTISSFAFSLALAPLTMAQVSITDGLTTTVQTDGEDTTIETAGSIALEDAGPALILNSDNILSNQGDITIADIDNATGVELQGGANRSFTNSGSITVAENFDAEDSDEDGLLDGLFAEGSGRTGILISGASPFEGNIELDNSSVVSIEGNDSFGINLTNTVMAQDGLTGNLSNAGSISVTGANATAINVASAIGGDFNNSGPISTLGENAQGINIDADIQGGFVNSGGIVNSGFRFTTRPGLSNEDLGTLGRDSFTAEDLLQAGSAVNINGNVTNGIIFEQAFVDVTDTDGTVSQVASTISTVTQTGSAPAINIDGENAQITIGRVAQITDPADENFNANDQFSFVNEGLISASGVFDDFDATGLQTANVTFTDGINNSNDITATSFRAPAEVMDADGVSLTDGDGIARAVALGNNTISPSFTNSDILSATASEPADLIFADRDNILDGRAVIATAVDIAAGADVAELTNSGLISASVTAREGTSTAIADSSGTLSTITNTGLIVASAVTSDTLGEENTNLNTVALNLSQNTTGVTLLQESGLGTPQITGDILLGSGNDSVTVTAGTVSGDLAFNAGNDSFALSGGSSYSGQLSNNGGLDISVAENSTLGLSNTTPVDITSANFDSTAVFQPQLNGETGAASVLNATGDITFDAGAAIAPQLTNVVGQENVSFALAQAGGNLNVGDLTTLNALNSTFLYDTNFAIDPADPNTLLITLDLRDPNESIANGGLGLDSAQASAFAPIFTALSNNQDLGNAFANISSSSEFNSAYNQILPEFSVAAHEFILANVDGAVGSVANHLDNSRRSQEKRGGVWLQEFGYTADRDLVNLSEEYSGSGFGFAAGIDTEFGPFHAVGLNIGFASTEVEDTLSIDDPLDIVTLQGGLYAGWATGKLGVEAYAGGGFNDFEQNRTVNIGSFEGNTEGDWSGTHINGSLRAGYDIALTEKYWIRPTLSLDYLRLSEDAYTETGDSGLTLAVDGRTTESAAATALFNFGAKFQGKRTWIRPSVRVGYRNEFINDPASTSFRFANLVNDDGTNFDSNTAIIESALFPDDGFILGFSIAAGSAFSSIGFDFDSDIRDGFIRHTGRIVVRLLF